MIDVGFTGYSDLMGVELPNTVVARCYTDVGVYTSNLADCEASEPLPDFNQCSRGNSGSVHGTAVAEAVIDIAPDATLYISQPDSWGDMQNTAAWMADQVYRSLTFPRVGPTMEVGEMVLLPIATAPSIQWTRRWRGT